MKGKNRVVMVGVVLAVAGVGLLLTRPWDREPVVDPVVDATGRPLPGVRIRVEVLNASDVSGLAGGATSYLRDLGLDVVYYGNAPEVTGNSSSVVDRVGDRQMAEAVAKALGIRNVLSEPDPELFVDASVMLGSEWLAPVDAPAVAPGARARWDPRSWFR